MLSRFLVMVTFAVLFIDTDRIVEIYIGTRFPFLSVPSLRPFLLAPVVSNTLLSHSDDSFLKSLLLYLRWCCSFISDVNLADRKRHNLELVYIVPARLLGGR